MTTTAELSLFGLPKAIEGCLFDLDGVLTKTEKLHAHAWKQMFDEFLRRRAEHTHTRFVPFDIGNDYAEYVDGKPRLVGTQSFLQSRGIDLPKGSESDPPDADTVYGLSNYKNDLVHELIDHDGVEVYQQSVEYVRKLHAAGMPCALVSSSANARPVLRSVGILDLFDGWVDGTDADKQKLSGKPAPDTYLAGAKLLGLAPDRAAIFDDALAGVEAGRAGEFGYVVGVDRAGHAAELQAHGADIVVSDLGELLTAK